MSYSRLNDVCHVGCVADTSENEFVTSNILSIFYHEIGHAIIDTLRLPVFGQEEDAANFLSIL